MKVKELIAQLSRCDGEANVYLTMQERWPWEEELLGVVTRANCVDEDGQPDHRTGPDVAQSDVLLVEGEQLRHGERGAWHAARRMQIAR